MSKVILLFSFIVFFSTSGNSQITVVEVPQKSVDTSSKIYLETEIQSQASFPGGDSAWDVFFKKNFDRKLIIQNGCPTDTTFNVRMRFIVSKDGTVADVYPETKAGYGIEPEIKRILKKGPNWIPALRYNRKVNSYKRYNVTVVIQN